MPQYLNILLQKSDPSLSWGFDIIGGREYELPLIICQVSSNSFSSQYLSKGDHIIQIEGIDSSLFSESEARSFIKKPSKSLDLLILKNPPNNYPHNQHFALKSDQPTTNDTTNNNNHHHHHHHHHQSKRARARTRPGRPLLRKQTNYQRTRSVPPAKTFETAPPLFSKKAQETLTYDRANHQSSVRGRSESPNFPTSCGNRPRSDDSSTKTMYPAFHRTPLAKQSSALDVECDREVARYCRRDQESESWYYDDSATTSAKTTRSDHSESRVYSRRHESFKYVMPVSFDYYENRGRDRDDRRQPRQMASDSDRRERSDRNQKHVSRVYLSPYDSYMRSEISKSLAFSRRQSSKESVDSTPRGYSPSENSPVSIPVPVNENSAKMTPMTPPAPPPPPPPIANGSIPAIRLKSEIPERSEPPAKIQSAMMKDKKPFTYTPGGIDLSEIKSPRMQRRIVRNAQTPEDVILPTTTTTTTTPINTQSLPPSAVAAMMPQIAIPVFPQNGIPRKPASNSAPTPPPPPPEKHQSHTHPTAPPPPQKQPLLRTTIANHSQPHQNQSADQSDRVASQQAPAPSRVQVGSLYVPPVTECVQSRLKPVQTTQTAQPQPTQPAFPTLREAPTPWLQKHQQPQNEESKPAWINRNKNTSSNNNHTSVNVESEAKEVPVYERKSRVQQYQVEKEKEIEIVDPNPGTRIIPIRVEGANTQATNSQSNVGPNSQRWGNDNSAQSRTCNNANTNKIQPETETKPIQSRSFKVIQRITGSEDDMTDYSSDTAYNNDNLPPSSQLKKLHLNEDDRLFMNKVRSQVNEDTYLHSETDPRYRGSVIPSRAFRMLQTMTDSGQVIPTTVEAQTPTKAKPVPNTDHNENEPQRKYIPPSERQAEQELRKYMGSSIPSRSFRMLQAMTATQETSKNDAFECSDKVAEEAPPFSHYFPPNPWPNPPKNREEVHLFWVHYMYLLNLVLEYLPGPEKYLWEAFYDYDDYGPGPGPDPGPAPEHGKSASSSRIEIIVTDSEIESSDYERPVPEVERNEVRQLIEKPAREELIITELIKDDSENDVSLTVCIPLKKKRKAVEYHEEITLHEPVMVEEQLISEALSAAGESAPSESESHGNGDQSLVDSAAAATTEHSSESSSVDFWKEIIEDEEDVFYKQRPKDSPLPEVFDDYDYQTDLADSENSAQPEPMDEKPEQYQTDGKLYDDDDDQDDDLTSAESSKDSDDTDEEEEEEEDDDDDESSSDDENDSYNVYEFRSHLVSSEAVEEPVKNEEDTAPILPSDLEDDSGMNSDVTKDIGGGGGGGGSGSELRKLTKYQRANTHSRLLKILLIEEEKLTSENQNELTARKESLTLPLTNLFAPESVSSSSGINSPISPVVANENLINELVQSMLKSNKGHDFRKLPAEKLREAAIKSLQAETSDTSRTSSPSAYLLSDPRTRTGSGADSYYDSCDENSIYYPGFDVLPSRAFKNLQSGRGTPMNWPKCPLISDQSPVESLSNANKTQDGLYKR